MSVRKQQFVSSEVDKLDANTEENSVTADNTDSLGATASETGTVA